ncbi:MAG: PAS domain-containing protein [Helicobacteraceae bacterium]|jgi:methyl-accepting chemotaxis protein|nr:PAS domain-containing protein [Helicobacteraceae bacterium]
MSENGRMIAVDEKSMLVSETDPSGIVRYINDDLIEISGFSEAELVGKPYDFMLHSSVPKSIPIDMGRAINEGGVWKGFVKHRTKGGDYYWVFMTVFPIDSINGEGYLAVRTRANEEEIERYEKKYEQMRLEETR